MMLFCITIRSKWGEPYNITLPGNSLEEVLGRITLDPGWEIGSYSILEVA
jgi:hypothetical protein